MRLQYQARAYVSPSDASGGWTHPVSSFTSDMARRKNKPEKANSRTS